MQKKKMGAVAFDAKRIAEGYRRRPFLHPQVMERFLKGKAVRFKNGLDVGCGAGLSSLALKNCCCRVTGVDISREMIEAAGEFCGDRGHFTFLQGRAEALTVLKERFDIATAAGVVQWVEQEPFLKGLYAQMEPGAPLLIYDFAVSDELAEEGAAADAYKTWWREEYLKQFPRPWRDEHVWSNEETEPCGFALRAREKLRLTWRFDREAFVRFMLIQSNVNARIEAGEMDESRAAAWFEKTLASFFTGERTLMFKGYLWVFERLQPQEPGNEQEKTCQTS